MKVIYKAPGKKAELRQVENDLRSLQSLVGGYIEPFTISTDACIICNEEGHLLGLPYNCTVCGVPFVGPILIVGVCGEEFCDLPIWAAQACEHSIFNHNRRNQLC